MEYIKKLAILYIEYKIGILHEALLNHTQLKMQQLRIEFHSGCIYWIMNASASWVICQFDHCFQAFNEITRF